MQFTAASSTLLCELINYWCLVLTFLGLCCSLGEDENNKDGKVEDVENDAGQQ